VTGLDPSAVAGIDVHVHVESDGHGQLSLDDELLAAPAKYFKAAGDRAPTVEQIADYHRQRQLAAVVFTVDAGTGRRSRPAIPGRAAGLIVNFMTGSQQDLWPGH
jgi:uncharacterized protein